MERVWAAAMPELLVAAGVAAGDLFTRTMDATADPPRTEPFRRVNDWYHVLVTGGAVYGIGTGQYAEIAKAALIADTVPLSRRLTEPLIAEAVGTRRLTAGRELASGRIRQSLNPGVGQRRVVVEREVVNS
jgi:hypothetical protein